MTARDDYPLTARLATHSPSHSRQREASAALDEIDRLRATIEAHRQLEHELLAEINRLRDIPPDPHFLPWVKIEQLPFVVRIDGQWVHVGPEPPVPDEEGNHP